MTEPAPGLTIDVTRLLRGVLQGRRPTGIDRVTLAYVRHFASHAKALVGRGRWVAELGAGLSTRLFAQLGAASGEGLRSRLQTAPRPRFLLHTGHSGLESAAYLSALERRGLWPVFLVHDLIPVTHPQFSRVGVPERHLLRLRHASQAGAGLVCNSEATRAALAEMCTAQGWRLPPTVVAHLGVEAWARPAGAHDLRGAQPARPWFVCVGTIEPRKNHLLLLRVWRQLAQRMGEHTPNLLLIGQRGWMYEEVVHDLTHDDVARRHVRELGDCSDLQLRQWLLGARAVLMPSLAEGFGLPVAEALACCVPVIASPLPVYREFAGSVPDYVDAQDVEGWAALIEDYCREDSAARHGQLGRLVAWQPPTWATHFKLVDDLLGRLARTRSAP